MLQNRISLRPLLAEKSIIPLLVADSPLTARAFAAHHAPAAAIGGFSVAAIHGLPDNGILSKEKYLSFVSEIMGAAPDTAFVIDGETGFGNPESTIAAFAKFPNASMVFIEDQVSDDKRCGHMDRHEIVSSDEMCDRLRSAVAGQQNGEPMIMARTDARSALGSIESAVERAHAYVDAGADAVFVEAPQSVEELRYVGEQLPNTPLLANIIEGGKTPELSNDELEKLGFSMVVRPVTATLLYAELMNKLAAAFYEHGSLETLFSEYGKPSLEKFTSFIGLKRD